MYYFTESDAMLVINVNRLDRDNKSQSTAIVLKVMEYELKLARSSADSHHQRSAS